jgi:hypothetical protein
MNIKKLKRRIRIMKTQENASLVEQLKESNSLLKSSNKTLAEGMAMDDTIAFALEQWKTNKHWFREEPGRVTTEDVIKMCIEFAGHQKQILIIHII